MDDMRGDEVKQYNYIHSNEKPDAYYSYHS